MKKTSLIILLLGCLIYTTNAQTVLYPGDLAIVGIQTDNPDDFSFVFLTTIKKNTIVYFSDCGVKADGSFRYGEGGLRYISPRDLAPGTLVDFVRDSVDFSKVNDGILGNRGFSLSSTGDQIIAFQDSSIRPHYLFAIQTNSSHWQSECTNANLSCIPPGLTDGYTALCAGKDTGSSNYWHNACIKTIPSGKTKCETLRELSNRLNWQFGNVSIPIPTQNISISPDSNRYLELSQDTDRVYNALQNFSIAISESNINRLQIRFVNLTLHDSLLLESQWPTTLRDFSFMIPDISDCDSFKLVFEDADFPGFMYNSNTWLIQDTVRLRLIEISRKLIHKGDSIKLVFNKAMLPVQSCLVLRNNSNSNDSINLNYSSGQIIMQGNELILVSDLVVPGNSYAIEITEGWMSDLRGNIFTGIDNNSFPLVSIAVEAAIDTMAPEIVSVNPNLDEEVMTDQKIRFIFNEPLFSNYGEITDPDVLGGIISIEDLNGNEYYDFIIEFDSLYTSFSLQAIGLEEGKSYYISMYGFADSIGNETDELIFTFKTETKVPSKVSSSFEDVLVLFPNPAQDYIQLTGKGLANAKIEVLDIYGKAVVTEIIEQSEDNIILNLHTLPGGAYLIRIDFINKIKQLRFIKN